VGPFTLHVVVVSIVYRNIWMNATSRQDTFIFVDKDLTLVQIVSFLESARLTQFVH